MLAEFVPCFTTLKCKRLQLKQVAVSHSFIIDIKLYAFKFGFVFLFSFLYICNTHVYIYTPKVDVVIHRSLEIFFFAFLFF